MAKIPFPSLLSAVIALVSAPAWAGEVPVADVPGLVGAIQAAKPGDTIVLAPGTYEVHQSKIACEAAGTAEAPIVVRAAELGSVTIRFDAVEGFHVRGPHWEFANLDIEGICAADSDCEHAFHVTGAAENTWLHHNRMHGFNAMIKGNGEPIGPGDSFVWPDDVVIEYNELYNPAPRDTGNPVTPIDVVGGQRWVLRGNFIHDHAKGGGDGVSYAAFLKGHSKDGLIERNLVVCELLHSGQVRLGLSLGGGGTGPDSICEDGACKPEHERGILRNNLIVNCPADVGVYVNAGADSKIVNNTLYNTAGVDMRFAETTGLVANNLMNGKVRDRDGGTSMKMNNLEEITLADFAAWFVDPSAYDFTLKDGAAIVDLGVALAEVTDDYCGNDRQDGNNDIGAIEYDGDGCVGGVPVESTGGGGTSTGGDESGGETGGAQTTGASTGGGATTAGNATDSPTSGASSPTSGPSSPTFGESESAGSGSGSDSVGDPAPPSDGCSCNGGSGGGAGALLGLMALGLGRRSRRR